MMRQHSQQGQRAFHQMRRNINVVVASQSHVWMIPFAGMLALLLLTACNPTSTTNAGASVTQSAQVQAQAQAQATHSAQATATDIAQMVTMTAQAQAQGSVASHHLKIIVTFTLANHASVPVHMYYVCGDGEPPITGGLSTTNGRQGIAVGGGPCQPNILPSDYPPIVAPGAAHTWVYTEDVSALTNPTTAGGLLIQPGVYSGTVTVKWHEGDITMVNGTPGHTTGKANTQITITIQ